jgi:hypothetical protein
MPTRSWFVVVALTLAPAVVLVGAPPVAAQPVVTEDNAKAVADAVVGELEREEIVPHKTVFATIIAGYHTDVAGFGELRLGYGKGKHKRNLLFPTTTLWRFSAAVRGSYGRADAVEGSLLAGWGKVGPLGFTIEAGLDARLTGSGAAGPMLALGFRLGPLGIHGAMAWRMVGETAGAAATIGLGYSFKDFIGPGEVAKARAKDELKLRGVPIP